MDQLLAHLFGDYVFQSDWMAINKTKNTLVCLLHALFYTAAFILFGLDGWLPFSWFAFGGVALNHFVIDRFYLARYVCYVKNFVAPKDWRYKWEEGKATGYMINVGDPDKRAKPIWMAVWLMIITDNSMHLFFNWLSFRYLAH